MKGDFSKSTFNAKKHFHDVLMQQGRVMLDADWNEQADIASYRTEATTKDIIGDTGAPMHNAGFEIVPVNGGKNISISSGHFYIDGILCENDKSIMFSEQPDFNATPLPDEAGTYVFYLDVWQRHITATEDGSIREVALGGPDCTTRTQIVWQVKCKINNGANCLTELPADVLNISTGKLNARSEETTGTDNPCGLIKSGGYRRLENQLYRAEIHTPGDRNHATFKWSRDNGSVIVKWEKQEAGKPHELIVSSAGRDDLLGFKSGHWIELINDETDLLNKPGVLVQLLKVDGGVFTIDPTTIIDPEDPTATEVVRNPKNPRIRRWDSIAEVKMNTTDNKWVALEDGVELNFRDGNFKTGDYWLIPARTAKADVEWPFTEPQLPQGIKHHFAKLAITELSAAPASTWNWINDCRPIFPPITELTSPYYISGDGQEAMPGHQLLYPLKVGVANGHWPVKNARVKFQVTQGDGSLLPGGPTQIITTLQDGIASCDWVLGSVATWTEGADGQQVKATLLDAADNELPSLPIIFNAKLTPPALFYLGGDGKSGMPGEILIHPLRVGVAFEQFPVNGAKVRFTVTGGGSITTNPPGGFINTPLDVITPLNGIAECIWQLGTDETKIQIVEAMLLNAADAALHLPIQFTADFNHKSGRGCSVTVGKDGQYKTLEEAFAKEQGKDICICLTLEEHVLGDLEGIRKDGTIKISGCGATIHMRGKQLSLIAKKIILSGFALVTEVRTANIKLAGDEISTDHCTFVRNGDNNETPFIVIEPLEGDNLEASVHLNDNRIVADLALALRNRVSGWIENNTIDGNLILQYFRDIRWTPQDAARIRNLLQQGDFQSLGSLRISGNQLENVITDADGIFNRGTIYKSVVISENIFREITVSSRPPFDSSVGVLINMVNNHVMEQNRMTVQLLGIRGIVIGNAAVTNNPVIQIFFADKIGVPPPALNLIRVVG